MKIDIWKVTMPHESAGVEEMKSTIGSLKVDAYSYDKNTGEIVEGTGWVASDNSYNYHNNYDNSKDCLWFNNKQQWFTLDYAEVLEVQRSNNRIILEHLDPILDRIRENL